MNKIFLFIAPPLLLAAACLQLSAQETRLPPQPSSPPPYWQQQADFDIRVTLNDNDHTLRGFETIRYTNRSPDTLAFLYIHCWPNAYKDHTTALYQQLSQMEERRGKLQKIKENGYIDQLNFSVNGTTALTEPHPKYSDILRLILPAKLPPGSPITITTPEAPVHYLAKEPASLTHSSSDVIAPGTLKTLDYHAENVHDFAWFADRSLLINYDTLLLPSGKIIDVFSYYHSNGNKEWLHSISYIKDAVLHYSKWIGEYDYPVVSALEGPGNTSSGGMEYPMITLITSPRAHREDLDGVIAHEVGHNWFYVRLGI